jgi:hypothetical protein
MIQNILFNYYWILFNMSSVKLQRQYIMNDAELYSFISILCNYIKRDMVDFAEFGVTESSVDNLYALARDFSLIYSDSSFRGDILMTIEERNKIRESVNEQIRKMVLRVQFRWNSDSTKLSRLGVGSLTNLTDGDVLLLARNVHSKMCEYLPDLLGQGLTLEILDDFSDLNDSFELAVKQKDDAKTQRLDLTAERITKGNELYRLAAAYCDLGKRLYAKKDSAKYNNYLLYPGIRSPIPKIPQNVVFDASSRLIKWDETLNATSYQAVSKLNNPKSKWKTIYKGESIFAEFKFVPGDWLIKIRARNSRGYGDWSDEIGFIC